MKLFVRHHVSGLENIYPGRLIFFKKNMRRTILDQPEILPRRAPENDFSGFLVFALVASIKIK